MLYAQMDLLSFEHLEWEIDALFRAFLDTQLLQLAADHAGNEEAYWGAVKALRSSTLNGKDATMDEEGDDTIQPSPEWAYLYWFDVRADYWGKATKLHLDELVAALLPPAYLKVLHDEAVALLQRIQHLGGADEPIKGRKIKRLLFLKSGQAIKDDDLDQATAAPIKAWEQAKTLLDKVKKP